MNKQPSIRLSNIELLRVIAMILIMFGHTYGRLHSMPTGETVSSQPITSYLDVLMCCIATSGVGIFIAISGWFGIRFRREGLAKYLFMVLFSLWVVYGIAIASGQAALNVEGMKVSLTFYDGYWFVMGYLGLYLFSPILNTFIEQADKKQFQIVLLSYYLFQSYYCWATEWYDYYNGYSIILFAGVYLTAAYLRKFPVDWVLKSPFKLWVVIVCISAVIATFFLWRFGHAARQIRDDNPLVIFASVLLVMGFSKMKFSNRIINWLAASCFAVYLIHYSPFVYPHFMLLMRTIYSQYDGLMYALMLMLELAGMFVACTLFDQIRIALWSLLNKYAILCRERTDGIGGDDSEVIHHSNTI